MAVCSGEARTGSAGYQAPVRVYALAVLHLHELALAARVALWGVVVHRFVSSDCGATIPIAAITIRVARLVLISFLPASVRCLSGPAVLASRVEAHELLGLKAQLWLQSSVESDLQKSAVEGL
jgi:hypothetical protein